jgi:hypothetical protein
VIPDRRPFSFTQAVFSLTTQLEPDFQAACADPTLLFKPYSLKFVPIPWA